MTYTSLVSDVTLYSERTDATFQAQIPRFILEAENRIASEARGLGFIQTVTSSLVSAQSFFQKPARWRETISFTIGTGSGNNSHTLLLLRNYEFMRIYWPDPTATGVPVYYGDWDYENWLIAPTPNFAFPCEILYHERPQPLDMSNQTNWTTQYAPQLLLYATLLETQPFLKRDDRIQVFQAQYDRALKQVEFEQKRRIADRSQSTQGVVSAQ